MMKFENRVAVITGAAGRIGRALAEEMGKAGVRLALIDINEERLREFAGNLSKRGIEAKAYRLDVTDSPAVSACAAEILKDFQKVDILINNAGVWPKGSFMDTDEALWNRVMDLNLNSIFRVTKAFAPAMIQAQYGRIVNLSSIAGVSGLPGLTAYSVAKAAVIMLTKNLAMEFAQYNITVNSVSPGMVLDEKKSCSGTWVGRTSTGDEVARVISFLAADDSGFITGADYAVDGGRTLGPHDCHFGGR